MSEINKSYRVRTGIGGEYTDGVVNFEESLIQKYDTFEILSVDIKSTDAYRLHNSNHGIIVGRVLANNGFGIPNAKISIFIKAENTENQDINTIYPFSSTVSKNSDGIRYNLLPNEKVDGCHQVVGSFPTKRYALDNDVILEVFDKYYKFTTKTNNSGDYMICGVPVGAHTLHMDLDLSDCGILSQKPRDFVYKGYTIEQFETPTKFKSGTDYGNLSQIFTQDQVVNVKPFWGNESLGESLGITRADVNVNFKFEPTCVFMGSIGSDNASNGYSKKCIPTDNMGAMDELVTGEGKIEMIRKTPGGNIEEFQIKGNKLINANGVWCYQIPMNLDYMVTDEYGNMVPTDNPETGIPTRASVRFRLSMEDHEENTENFFRAKVLVPHNPQNLPNGRHEECDYEFGTYTRDDSFRDLFWNNVYSVKSYIPRIQKNKNPKKEKFSGIKHCNNFGPNNPIPYNNIRIKMPLMFTIMCALIKAYIFIVSIINTVNVWIFSALCTIINLGVLENLRERLVSVVCGLRLIVLKDGLCPDLENWYFSPCNAKTRLYTFKGCTGKDDIKDEFQAAYDANPIGLKLYKATNTFTGNCDNYHGPLTQIYAVDHSRNLFWEINLLERTLGSIEKGEFEQEDNVSIDATNKEEEEENESICITKKTDYLIACIEMNLAQEYKVINFDFYNDWLNGFIYNPRWVRFIKPKTRFLWINWSKEKVKGCMEDTRIYSTSRRYVQQCSINYRDEYVGDYRLITDVDNPISDPTNTNIKRSNNLHKRRGLSHQQVFGKNGGICHQSTTMLGQYVYYLKPCEWINGGKKVNLYATDIILLGTFNDCDLNGIPTTFTHLSSSSYIMPTNIALTNMDTNGALYATSDGTVCMGGTTKMDEITQIDGNNTTSALTLENEIKFYSSDPENSLNEATDYPGGIDLDTIALTEAAGISWNFTGPGQGVIEEKKMYYPGGHFLGISCVNAQTNLKSCINLSRICEIGTNMSQRRDSVRSSSGGTLYYTYTAPSGFIAADEISDSDFRSMFATMNKKRLIATKRNPDTGYKFYDFEFSMPINFNGSFKRLAKNNKYPYNQKVDVKEENLEIFGINLGPTREDFDLEETGNTQIRTRETVSLDYYLFRLGMTYEQLSDFSLQKRKFLRDPEGDYGYRLPQYENSYYFYFGLKYGATALDEFNKQFYAECDNLMLTKEPNVILTADVDFCNAGGRIHVITEGLDIPYQSITIYNDIVQAPVYVIDGSLEIHRNCLTSEMFNLINNDSGNEIFEFGNYKVVIVDSNGVTITRTVSIGLDMVHYMKYVVDFNQPIEGVVDINIPGYREGFNGGYVCVYDLSIDNMELSDFSVLKLGLFTDYELSDSSLVDSANVESDETNVFGREKEVNYILALIYKCADGSEHKIRLERVTFHDNSDVKLKIGNQTYSRECICGNDQVMSKMQDQANPNGYWWDEYGLFIGGEDNIPTAYVRWYYKALMFNRNKTKNTFDSNIFAVNSRKVTWGTPQCIRGLSNSTACTETTYDMEPGYYLDDKYSYYSTYGTNDCDITPIIIDDEEEEIILRSGIEGEGFYPNCIMHFCSQAYKGTNACGAYHGTYTSENGVNFFDRSYFRDGYGCIFKPLPQGRLKFMIFDSTNNYQNMLDELDGYEKGIFYPSFIYPVIKRPFFIMSDFYKWTERNLIYSSKEARMIEYEKGYNVNAEIHNGVTFNYKFNEDSWITGLQENYFLNKTLDYEDWYGLTERTNNDRITYASAFTSNQLESTAVGYHIQEGYPTGELEQFTKIHDLTYNPGFYSQIGYEVRENNENGETYIDKFLGIGSTDTGATYYYFKVGNGNNLDVNFVHNSNDYYYWRVGVTHTYYALCKFIKGTGYQDNIVVNDSLNESEVIVKFIFKSLNGSDYVNISFNYIDINGNEQLYDNDLRVQHNQFAGGTNEITKLLRILHFRRYFPDDSGSGSMSGFADKGYNMPLCAVKKSIIEENPTVGNIGYTWEDIIRYLAMHNRLRNEYLITHNVLVPSKDTARTRSEEKLFGVGILNYTDDEGNKATVYKIYKDLVKVNGDYVGWEGDGNGNVWLSSEHKTINAAHTEFSIQFSASSPTTITLEVNNKPDWIYSIVCDGNSYINNSGNITCDVYRPDVYTLNFIVYHNNDSSNDREYVVNFHSTTADNSSGFTLTQTKALLYNNAPKYRLSVECITGYYGSNTYNIRLVVKLKRKSGTLYTPILPTEIPEGFVDYQVGIGGYFNGGYQTGYDEQESFTGWFGDVERCNHLVPYDNTRSLWLDTGNGMGIGQDAHVTFARICDSLSEYKIETDIQNS